MPPAIATGNGNRIGLGVYTEDGADRTLNFLREVETRLRSINQLSRSTNINAGGPARNTTQQARQDSRDQLRLFQEGQNEQIRLFSHAEQEKYRIRQSYNRRARLDAEQEYDRDVQAYQRAQRRKTNIEQFERGGPQRFDVAPTANEVELARVQRRAQQRADVERLQRLRSFRFQEPAEGTTERELYQRDPAAYRRFREALHVESFEKQPPIKSSAATKQAYELARRIERDNTELYNAYRRAAENESTYEARTGGPYRQARGRVEQPPKIPVGTGTFGPGHPLYEQVQADRLFYEQEHRARAGGPGLPPIPPSQQGQAGDPLRRRQTRFTQTTYAQDLDKELAAVNSQAARLAGTFGKLEHDKRLALDLRQQAGQARRDMQGIVHDVERLNVELGKPPGQRRKFVDIARDVQGMKSGMAGAKREAEQLNAELAGAGPNQSKFANSIYAKGLFGFGGYGGLGSIIAISAVHGAYRQLTQGIHDFVAASIEAARAESDVNNELQAASNISGRLLSENLQIVEALHERAGLTRTIAGQAVASGQRFAERAGRTGETAELTGALVNIARARGVRPQQFEAFFEQAQNQQGRFAERYLGQRVETIYQQYVLKNRAQLSQGLPEGQATLSRLTTSLTDYERAQALSNAVMAKGNQLASAAAERQDTLAGRIDRSRAAWDDLLVTFGKFITGNQIVVGLLERAVSLVKSITPEGETPGQGPGGLLTEAQIRQRIAEQSGGRQRSQLALGGLDALIATNPLVAGGRGVYGLGQAATSGGATGFLAQTINPLAGVIGAYNNLGKELYGGLAEAQAELETRQEQAKRIRELLETKRFVPTGGPINFQTGQGFRVKSEQEIAAETDRQLDLLNRAGRQQTAIEYARGRAGTITNQIAQQDFLAQINAVDEALSKLLAKPEDVTDQQVKALTQSIGGLDNALTVALTKQREQEELFRRQEAAAKKLRETVTTSYQLIPQVAARYVQGDNPFVQLFSDGASAAERMHQSFGYLGQETEQFFTGLERHRNDIALLSAQFDSLGKAQELSARAVRESLERQFSPELSRREQDAVNIAQAAVGAATRIPDLMRQLSVLRFGAGPQYLNDPRRLAISEIQDITGATGGIGLGPEGRRAVARVRNEAIAGILGQLPRGMILNSPFLRATGIEAAEGQIDEQRAAIRDAIHRARITAGQDEELAQQFRQADALRQRLTNQGRDATQVGRFYDRLILARTEGINPRDLTETQFELRNAALRREAERQLRQEEEARAAVDKGLEYQQQLVALVAGISRAITSGDMSLLIQVENDTQARLDATNLRDLAGREGIRPERAAGVLGGTASRGGNPFASYGRPGHR